MNRDNPGRTQDEVEDKAKYTWARGKRAINAVAYTLSEFARDGKPISPEDVREFHFHLIEVWGLLLDATVGALGPEPRSEEEQLLREASYEIYSDGTPVATLVRIPGRDADPVPIELCEYIVRHGPTPPGWQIVVGDPPHGRPV
jgi:hypothetical protein